MKLRVIFCCMSLLHLSLYSMEPFCRTEHSAGDLSRVPTVPKLKLPQDIQRTITQPSQMMKDAIAPSAFAVPDADDVYETILVGKSKSFNSQQIVSGEELTPLASLHKHLDYILMLEEDEDRDNAFMKDVKNFRMQKSLHQESLVPEAARLIEEREKAVKHEIEGQYVISDNDDDQQQPAARAASSCDSFFQEVESLQSNHESLSSEIDANLIHNLTQGLGDGKSSDDKAFEDLVQDHVVGCEGNKHFALLLVAIDLYKQNRDIMRACVDNINLGLQHNNENRVPMQSPVSSVNDDDQDIRRSRQLDLAFEL